MDWNTLSKFHFQYYKPKNITFNRTELIQQQYDLYIKNTSNIYNDICNKYFNNNDLFVFVKNNYPYNIKDNIEHYILWFNPIIYKNKLRIILNIEYISVILNIYLKKLFNNNKKYICFMNIPKHQTIKEIYHYQVFIKNNNN